MGLPISDVQHENPRGVGKGRLLTRCGLLAFPIPVTQSLKSGLSRPTLLRTGSSGHSRSACKRSRGRGCRGSRPPRRRTPTGAVFLSYASQDAGAAQRICDSLRAAGIEVWFDQSELRGGDAWDQSIRRQIKTCALFIPVISQNTHARAEGYFRLEWKLAVDRSHLISADKAFLLPVVIDDTPDDDQRVPDRFREVQWTRLPGGETPAAFLERVKRLLSPESTPTADPARSAGSAVGSGVAAASRVSRRRTGVLYGAIAAMLLLTLGYLGLEHFNRAKPSVRNGLHRGAAACERER